MPNRRITTFISAACALFVISFSTFPQSNPKATPPIPKTIFRDSDGNLVSNNEFVDIRMANFHYPDATIVKTLEDGTVEFRLQKIPQEGVAVPAWTFETVDGSAFTPSELKGKVVVVNFWFIGCPSCRKHMPKLTEFRARFAASDDVVFVAMTADPADRVRKFLEREKFDYHMVADAGPIMKSIGFGGYPKNFVIGKDGRIAYWRSTIHAWEKFESVVRTELAK
ncbi:MAG: TlpA family protein disulfide reductase [Acidobacteria bacterium]|nr:TlpA family protein disulfide reductase [Acidobacteriota bacterium]